MNPDLDDLDDSNDPPPMLPEDDFVPNEGQRVALARIGDFLAGPPGAFGLTGPAGTGKTTILRMLRGVVARHVKGETMWTAMTGKAATRMIAAANVPASTLHVKLYEPPEVKRQGRDLEFGPIRDPEGTLLVVDEASMVTPQIAKDIGQWTKAGVHVLYVGDGFQLPPILSKEEQKKHGDYTVFAHVPHVALTQVMRNGDDILDAATMLRTKATLPQGVSRNGTYEWKRVPSPTEAAIQAYLDDPEDHGLITWVNATRMGANLEIRRRLGIHDPQPQPGEPILVCRNALRAGVLNGEVYRIASMTPGVQLGTVPTFQLTTVCGRTMFVAGHHWEGSSPYFPEYDDWKAYRRDINDLRVSEPIPITYGHVLTAHKAQGSEFRRVTVFLPRRDHSLSHFRTPTMLPDGQRATFGTRWLYTALTRARSRVSIFVEG